jgi:predicted nucleotidyltransferase
MDLTLPPDFKEFLKLLKEHDVRYLLIGGYAVGYHGYARATEDMDIWVAIHPDNAQNIVAAMKAFGLDDPNLTPELLLQKPKIIRMGFPPLRLEITTSISGVGFDECYASRITDTLDGVEVNIIDLPHLKANKKAAGRHKDLADLENLP